MEEKAEEEAKINSYQALINKIRDTKEVDQPDDAPAPYTRHTDHAPITRGTKIERTGLFGTQQYQQLTQDERDLARQGEKIQCIKSIRARMGIGLKEAKDLYEVNLAAMEVKDLYEANPFAAAPQQQIPTNTAQTIAEQFIEFKEKAQLEPPLPDQPPLFHLLTQDEHDLAKQGEKIQSIKSIRARMGIGLKEAKDLYEVNYPIMRSTKSS